MVNLTFGEQVKIILSRKGMTIKELAELVEKRTGKNMSRQNMTQRLGRDNFQEQDMRLIAEILGCKFQLSIMEMEEVEQREPVKEVPVFQQEITVGEVVALHPTEKEPEPDTVKSVVKTETVDSVPAAAEQKQITAEAKQEVEESEERKLLKKGIKGYFRKKTPDHGTSTLVSEKKNESAQILGEINPYTGKEYKSNSVRIHPKRIGYVQVYDQTQHKWNDMTEWAFLGNQERKKALLGKDYEPPIYLD